MEKPALWDFLRDVVQNINRDARGNYYALNTKCLGKIIKVYGSHQMVDLFALNFGSVSYNEVKRDVQRGVQFIAGEHSHIFAAVVENHRNAKLAHGIEGPVPIILAKDKTKVKGRVAWKTK